jgi:speckle-type POZ protein
MNISGWLLLVKPDCSLSADSGQLFEKRGFADVILSANGRKLHAHKAVLSARSSVFSVLFRHDILENKNNRVEADDVRYDVLQEMVHFIYAGRTPNLIEMSYELLQAAEKYYLERLKVMCKDVLCLNLTTENVAGTLILAGLHSAKQWKERCLSFIAECGKDIIQSDGWKIVLQSHPKFREEAIIALDIGMQSITTCTHRK